eukprot:m.430180 g.430180  ORF g.430180 m.430180 type:complete len:71 (+) comp17121_c0_seq1:2667-2879(+)
MSSEKVTTHVLTLGCVAKVEGTELPWWSLRRHSGDHRWTSVRECLGLWKPRVLCTDAQNELVARCEFAMA